MKRGTIIQVKNLQSVAVVIKYNSSSDTVEYYYDGGHGLCARSETKVYREQPTTGFKPMRVYLPYGKLVYKDGSEVLFNRNYIPIWEKSKNGGVNPIESDTRIEFLTQTYYYSPDRSPWTHKTVFSICMKILKEWGVEDRTPTALSDFNEFVKTGVERKSVKVKDKFPIIGGEL